MRTDEPLRCSQPTRTGKPCRSFAVAGSDRCSSHLGRAGRKSQLTDEVAAQLEAILRAGNYIDVACRAVGIPRRTFDHWMQRGHEGAAAYVDFASRMDKARANGEVRNVAMIAQAASESWQAAAWLLERTSPERWARVSQRDQATPEPTAPDTGPLAEIDELAARRRAG